MSNWKRYKFTKFSVSVRTFRPLGARRNVGGWYLLVAVLESLEYRQNCVTQWQIEQHYLEIWEPMLLVLLWVAYSFTKCHTHFSSIRLSMGICKSCFVRSVARNHDYQKRGTGRKLRELPERHRGHTDVERTFVFGRRVRVLIGRSRRVAALILPDVPMKGID